jgi:membrane-associated phospholipid phosphatase
MRTLTVLTVLLLCVPVHAQSAHSPDDVATAPFANIEWAVRAAPADLATFSAARGGQGETHPPPRHTGFKALLFETASDFNAFPRRTSTWVILGIGGAAAAGAHHFDATVNQRLVGSEGADTFFKAGKYIGAAYVQAGAAVGLYVVGRYVMPHAADAPKTNKVSHLGFDLLRGLILSQTITQAMKVTIQRDRPTGECCAFPSGHASAAFATASVIERHLGYRGAIPTYAIAAYVAASRMHDNRHYLSDVVFGGALGIASGWTVVGRHGRGNYALVPVPVPRGFAINLIRSTE